MQKIKSTLVHHDLYYFSNISKNYFKMVSPTYLTLEDKYIILQWQLYLNPIIFEFLNWYGSNLVFNLTVRNRRLNMLELPVSTLYCIHFHVLPTYYLRICACLLTQFPLQNFSLHTELIGKTLPLLYLIGKIIRISYL